MINCFFYEHYEHLETVFFLFFFHVCMIKYNIDMEYILN